jgi:hypothetical protein
MSDLPDRPSHPFAPGEPSGPRRDGSPGSPDEERTAVHPTAAPGAQDSSVTAFTPAPREQESPQQPAPEPDGAAPAAAAHVAAQAVPRKVNVRNRGRMRRRLRYLRRVRELGYRDLGGLVFELRRAGAENEVLVGAKVDALTSIDQELHVLEHGLRDFRSVEELHEPGVSVCLRCGALHGSDANFCPQCGIRVDQHTSAPTPAEPATVAPGTTGTLPADGGTTGTGRLRR